LTYKFAKLLLGVMFGLLLAALPAAAAVLTTSTFPLAGKSVERAETTLGNLFADALRPAANADLAFVNASQIRPVNLPAGPITDEQIASVVAYPDETIALVQLKGSVVTACLERGLSQLPRINKGFLQISGLTVKFDSGKYAGKRIIEIKIGDKPLEANKIYKAAMPLSLAKGSGGYFTILNGSRVKPLDTTLQAAIASYLKTRGATSAKSDTPRLEDIAKTKD